ncbi:MAG: multicopper oxidase family protein [Polyangiales bacterium]
MLLPLVHPTRLARRSGFGIAIVVAAACGCGPGHRLDSGTLRDASSDTSAPRPHDGATDGGTDGGRDGGEPARGLPDVIHASGELPDLNPAPQVTEVNLVAREEAFEFTDGVFLDRMAYNGVLPGPMLHVWVGDEVLVHFKNELDQPTTVHWHGMRVPNDMDGSPHVQSPVEPGGTYDYHFTVPDAGTYWFHPHVRSFEQVERGLYGVVVVHDPREPRYDADRVLMLDDILLDENTFEMPPFLATTQEVEYGRLGNILLTNGAPSEGSTAVAKRGQVERWRLVNAANARTMELDIVGASYRIIGTDGGPLETPFTTDEMLLSPGQRLDVEVSFDTPGDAKLVSYRLVQEPPMPPMRVPTTVHAVHVAASAEAPPVVPWPSFPERDLGEVDEDVTFTLSAIFDPETGIHWTINGLSHPMDPLFTFAKGTTVHMTVVNNLGYEHPFHMHGEFFRVIPEGNPWTAVPGLHDTVLVPGNHTVEVIAKLDNPGRWMVHCHILEHAERGMMSDILVTDP